jgi:hypothetical protein
MKLLSINESGELCRPRTQEGMMKAEDSRGLPKSPELTKLTILKAGQAGLNNF